MKKCSDIIKIIEDFAPVSLAEDWDNVGLLVGNKEKEIKKVLLCLDVTLPVVKEAIEKKIDLIISHHPFIFKPLKRISTEGIRGKTIEELIKNDISVYCAHTNLDIAIGGVNDCLAETVGLKDIRNLDMSGKEYGLGRIGYLKKSVSFNEFISLVKSVLNTGSMRIIGETPDKIEKVAVFCGAFDDEWNSLLVEKPDVLISGDIKYHTAQQTIEFGMCIIDAGHFNTEAVILPKLQRLLKEIIPQVDILCNTVEKDPFNFY